jgi:predicted component of type VI protein secretion system
VKAINVSRASPTLREVLKLAAEDNVLLRTSEGRQYVLAEIDDFAEELTRVRNNAPIMQLLNRRSKEPAHLSLSQVREKLHGKRGRQGKRPSK